MTDHAAPGHLTWRDRAGWVVWVLVNVACVVGGVSAADSIRDALRTDASVVGTFADPDRSSCPERVEFEVDGETYSVSAGSRGWCSRDNGDLTSPQRVYYDSDDPGVAVFADPGGTTPTVVLDVVVIVLLLGLVGWLQWLRRDRLRPWWSRRPT